GGAVGFLLDILWVSWVQWGGYGLYSCPATVALTRHSRFGTVLAMGVGARAEGLTRARP
ncbi:hypothetical protein ACLOJK_018806, partial [Asimina triloba]